jgi:hypothetical protein
MIIRTDANNMTLEKDSMVLQNNRKTFAVIRMKDTKSENPPELYAIIIVLY